MCIRLFLFRIFFILFMRTCSLSFGIIISMTFMHTFSFSILGPFLLAFCVKPRVFILFYLLSSWLILILFIFLIFFFFFFLPLSSLIQVWLWYISSLPAAFVNKLHIPSVMSLISAWLILSVFLETFAYDHKLPLLLPRQFQLNNHAQLLVSKQV